MKACRQELRDGCVRRSGKDRGMTLVEVVIALTIFAMSIGLVI